MPNVERPDPPYMQVARHFRDRIIAGQLEDGDSLPSARQIAREWDLSLATATKVLNQLRAEGLVRGVPGVGTVVHRAGQLHQSARDRSVSIQRTGKIYPPGHYATIRSAELVAAPDAVAATLGIEGNAPAIRRRRTTYDADDRPISTSVSWFDGAFATKAPLLLSDERIPEGTTQYAAEQTGCSVASTNVQLAADAASEDVASELHVEPGSPVLISQNRFVDDDGAIIEYGESAAVPNSWVFFEYPSERTEGKS